MRYKLRSSTAKAVTSLLADSDWVDVATPSSSTSTTTSPTSTLSTTTTTTMTSPPMMSADSSASPLCKRARLASVRRRSKKKSSKSQQRELTASKTRGNETTFLLDLPHEVLLHVTTFMDGRAMLRLAQTCRQLWARFCQCNAFWKRLCYKEELANYPCLQRDPEDVRRLGWQLQPLHVLPPVEMVEWRRVYLRGVQMRRNIRTNNYRAWRIYANCNLPVVQLTPGLDLNHVRARMGDFPKLSENDDLKIDWNDQHLVVFHFFRGEGESCVIRVWDIRGPSEPQFLYSVEKGIECISDKVSVVSGHVVIVPSWPLQARAIVMSLDLSEKKKMAVAGKFIFNEETRQRAVDEQWEHTQLRVVKKQALVMCRCPHWCLLVVSLPECQQLFEVNLMLEVGPLFDCQQIRSYKHTAMVMFVKKDNDTQNLLLTVDVNGADTKVRSVHESRDVADVALFTDPEEIFIIKRQGQVVTFDANNKKETKKIKSKHQDEGSGSGSSQLCEYQLFVNRKEQICVMQSSTEVEFGRNISVYSYNEEKLYTINLDLCQYSLSRDESICIYTNGAFLAAADAKKLAIFNVRTGEYVTTLHIPPHLERSKGKDEKDCMFEQTGLSLFIFDEDTLLAVHDYERSFPAVLDIYKFW